MMSIHSLEFFKFIKLFKEIPGAISVTEAIAVVHVITTYLKIPGFAVELGAHAGKSAVASSYGLMNIGVKTYGMMLVDPVYDISDTEWRGFCPESQTPDFKERVYDRVKTYFPESVAFYGELSTDFLKRLICRMPPILFNYAFVDTGAHEYKQTMTELEFLAQLLLPGAIVALHDYGNQFIGPKMAAEEVILQGKFVGIPIDWEVCKILADKYGGEHGNNSWHMQGEKYPNYVGFLRKI